MIYQEQVQQAARVLAGYTLGGRYSAPRDEQKNSVGDGPATADFY